MNLNSVSDPLLMAIFRTWRCVMASIPGGRIDAFGESANQIGSIVIVNLDRQPRRLRRVSRELGRFRTSDGVLLTAVARRQAAVDARDGRAVAATSDVDAIYQIGDQLFVQPDSRLAECFADDEPVRMTRQELAVARSHVEAWKAVASGGDEYVLVLEDDVWFKPGASTAIERGWREALERRGGREGPKLLYLSYSDAGGTAQREDVSDALFRPVRGLWFLSGYVLSRQGAMALLRAMPVVGPVDLWINYRFSELDALALASPVLAQRHDGASDNAYSVLPYLARAGIVDAERRVTPPNLSSVGPVLAWTEQGESESLAMALSMLGLRVRVFDGDEPPMTSAELSEVLNTFDALVDAPLVPSAFATVMADKRSLVLLEPNAPMACALESGSSQLARSTLIVACDPWSGSWDALCGVLGVVKPVDEFPTGAPRRSRLLRDDRLASRIKSPDQHSRDRYAMDESPWVLPPASRWLPAQGASHSEPIAGTPIAEASMTEVSALFPDLVETFPGNLASFAREQILYGQIGAQLVLDVAEGGPRPYSSGAFASASTFAYGRFEATIRAASGPGLVTGFFLHRGRPRQEIDIEFPGSHPRQMLVNVYFNPGDDGAAADFGYRGSPWTIDLGFDASADFHVYAIEWRNDRLVWLVDGNVVHVRVGWDPTPIPHLNMRLHCNLWAPRSEELAGRLDRTGLPSSAVFRDVHVTS